VLNSASMGGIIPISSIKANGMKGLMLSIGRQQRNELQGNISKWPSNDFGDVVGRNDEKREAGGRSRYIQGGGAAMRVGRAVAQRPLSSHCMSSVEGRIICCRGDNALG
jgi:hypothetical protein